MHAGILEAQKAADRLEPIEQVRLLEYITQQVERFLGSLASTTKDAVNRNASSWSAFFEAGDRLLADDASNDCSLTQTLLSMRR